VWGAWRGEASNHIALIEERHFEFTTIGTLILPEHAFYWRQLCDHQQLFTVDAHALVKSYLERCLPQGMSPTLFTPAVDMHPLSNSAHCGPFQRATEKQIPYSYALVSSVSSLHFLHGIMVSCNKGHNVEHNACSALSFEKDRSFLSIFSTSAPIHALVWDVVCTP